MKRLSTTITAAPFIAAPAADALDKLGTRHAFRLFQVCSTGQVCNWLTAGYLQLSFCGSKEDGHIFCAFLGALLLQCPASEPINIASIRNHLPAVRNTRVEEAHWVSRSR
jgi:hypothetical protein